VLIRILYWNAKAPPSSTYHSTPCARKHRGQHLPRSTVVISEHGLWIIAFSTHSNASGTVSVRQEDCMHLRAFMGCRFIDSCGLEWHANYCSWTWTLQAIQSSAWRTGRVVVDSVTLSLSKFLYCIYGNSRQSSPLGPVPMPGSWENNGQFQQGTGVFPY
jgi:hypothetical protein